MADPITGYHRSLDAMARVKGADRKVRYVGRGGAFANDQERDAFLAQPVESRWNGMRTIGCTAREAQEARDTAWLLFEYARDYDRAIGRDIDILRSLNANMRGEHR